MTPRRIAGRPRNLAHPSPLDEATLKIRNLMFCRSATDDSSLACAEELVSAFEAFEFVSASWLSFDQRA